MVKFISTAMLLCDEENRLGMTRKNEHVTKGDKEMIVLPEQQLKFMRVDLSYMETHNTVFSRPYDVALSMNGKERKNKGQRDRRFRKLISLN